MARRRSGKPTDDEGAAPNNGATIGHEAELWAMADALRGSMDAAEYKHVVLGLIFLKYTSDALDAAVATAYGWPADISDEDCLRDLLGRNLQDYSVEA